MSVDEYLVGAIFYNGLGQESKHQGAIGVFLKKKTRKAHFTDHMHTRGYKLVKLPPVDKSVRVVWPDSVIFDWLSFHLGAGYAYRALTNFKRENRWMQSSLVIELYDYN